MYRGVFLHYRVKRRGEGFVLKGKQKKREENIVDLTTVMRGTDLCGGEHLLVSSKGSVPSP